MSHAWLRAEARRATSAQFTYEFTSYTVYCVSGAAAMFSLLYGLWEYLIKKEELHILMLGAGRSPAHVQALTCMRWT